MSSWLRRGARRGKRPTTPQQHTKKRPLASGIEALEERTLMSGDGLQALEAYDAGAAYVAPLWFESLSQSNAARSETGLSTFEQTTASITWKGAAVDVYMDEWIVQLTREASAQVSLFSDVTHLLNDSSLGIEVIGGLGLQGQVLVRARGVSTDAIGQWFDKQASVAYYEPNAILPLERTTNDPSTGQTWGLNNTGQTINGQAGVVDADIDAPEAWDLTTGSRSIVVGIIDTGVDYNHVDLAANIWTNPGEVAGNGIDDDHNGFVDDIHGYDFVNNDGDPMDDNGHGTHVAGTIGAAGNNATGVAGINWSTSIMALKFLSSSGSGSLYDAVRAINYATMMRTQYGVNIRLTNNSWGGGGYNQSLYDAINANGQAGILFVAAAGNNSSNNDTTASYPSNYNLSNVIAVAATDNRDQLASFSNYGATTVDLAAPGVSILSAKNGGGYQYMSGTSMATPHVAGVAALAWALDPNASVQQVRDAILNGADRISSLTGKVATGGRLNARGALEQLGMRVVGSTPAADATVTTAPVNFTIDFSHNFDPATVQAADFRVNGIAANNYTIVDANSITFRFNASPVTAQGPQTMQIAAGAIGRSGGGSGFTGWQGTFHYDQTAMAVVATTPGENATLNSAPTSLTFVFNEAVDASSVSASDLLLSSGTVTGATLVNPTTVRYTLSLPTFEGTLTYTLARGALTDAFGNPSAAYTGRFAVDDPTVVRYQASGLPSAVPDLGTIVSTLNVADDFLISDVDVEVTLAHTWNADLDVYLIAPDGTRVELFTDVGGSGQGFTGTILDDQAIQDVGSGTAPFTGRFRPEGLLSALNGKRTAGAWKLEVSDDYEYDTGSIVAWSLQLRVVRGPQLAAIADQTMAHTTDAIEVPFSASTTNDAPTTYSARAVSVAYGLDQKLDLWSEPSRTEANYYYNYNGLQEKWIRGGSDRYYALLPNGELRQWASDVNNMALVGTVPLGCYADPSLLIDAAVGESVAAVSVDAARGRLTVNPHNGFTGDFFVELAATANGETTFAYFRVTVSNGAPQLSPINDVTVAHGLTQIDVPLTGVDADGDPLTFTAAAVAVPDAQAYTLDRQLELWAEPFRAAANYFYNFNGLQEKWIRGGSDQYYALFSDGRLMRWGGSLSQMVLVATVDPSLFADPTRLLEAATSSTTLAASVGAGGLLSVTPPAHYVGDILVTASVTDGAATDTRSFVIHVVNQGVTLTPLADQTISHRQDQFSTPLSVTNPDGDPLTYSVVATGQLANVAYQLDQQLGLWAEPSRIAANYYYNYNGLQEKWIGGSNDTYYGLFPNGELRRWTGSLETMTLVATLDRSYYDNPATLLEAQPTPVGVAAAVSAGGVLTIDPPTGFVGDVQVAVTVSDGVSADTKSFTLHVVNQAPQLAAIAGRTITAEQSNFVTALSVINPDGDPLTYSVVATGQLANVAYQLDQQLGLWAEPSRIAANYYYNYNGLQEKWVRGSNDTYYGLFPNGELRRWTGSLETMTLVATLDRSYYDNPATLLDAQPTPVGVAAAVSGGMLTVSPPTGFVGDVQVTVAVSDGAQSDTQSFVIHVTGPQSAAVGVAVSAAPLHTANLPLIETTLTDGVTPRAATSAVQWSTADLTAAADYSGQRLFAQSVLAEPLRDVMQYTSVAMPNLGAVAKTQAAVSWAQEVSLPATSALSPTGLLHHRGQLESRLLQPLAAARAERAERFSLLADHVFADLDMLEAALLEFDVEINDALLPRD